MAKALRREGEDMKHSRQEVGRRGKKRGKKGKAWMKGGRESVRH